MSIPFARRAWRRLESEAKRLADGRSDVRALLEAHRDANGVRAPVDEAGQRAAAELAGKVEAWLRASHASRDAMRAEIGFLAAAVGEALDESVPAQRFRQDVDG